jgi:hypothetical protein
LAAHSEKIHDSEHIQGKNIVGSTFLEKKHDWQHILGRKHGWQHILGKEHDWQHILEQKT